MKVSFLISQYSKFANRYAITTRYNVNLAVCDGTSNINAYLSTARNSIAAWMNNLDSNTLVHFERLNIGSISIPNIGTIIADKNVGIASSGRATFCLPYISNGKICMFEAIGLQHYYEINGTTFIDHGSEVSPSGTIISVGVCIFEKA